MKSVRNEIGVSIGTIVWNPYSNINFKAEIERYLFVSIKDKIVFEIGDGACDRIESGVLMKPHRLKWKI